MKTAAYQKIGLNTCVKLFAQIRSFLQILKYLMASISLNKNAMKLNYLIIVFSLIYIHGKAQSPSFNQYRVSLYKGSKASLKIKGNDLAERYKTTISNIYYSKKAVKNWQATGLNFGGHYCFVSWGCGSPCQESAIVDLKTGLVYQGPTASLGYKFNRLSRLVIINPGYTTDDCAFCKQEYWILNERTKKFKQILQSFIMPVFCVKHSLRPHFVLSPQRSSPLFAGRFADMAIIIIINSKNSYISCQTHIEPQLFTLQAYL